MPILSEPITPTVDLVPAATTEDILDRVDKVIRDNKIVEWIYIILALILFMCGITALIKAMTSSNYLWSLPPIITTFLLKFPFEKIMDIRKQNIALAIVPILVTQLSKEEATKELQKLIGSLYPKDERSN